MSGNVDSGAAAAQQAAMAVGVTAAAAAAAAPSLGPSSCTAGSQPPTLLSLPPDVLALIASQLRDVDDRLRLEASCRTLLAVSQGVHSSTWWGGRRLKIELSSPDPQPDQSWEEADEEQAARVSRLLATRRPNAACLRIDGYGSEVQVVAPCLPAPPLEGVQELAMDFFFISRRSWVSIACQTQLTSLTLEASFVEGPCRPALRTLPALQRLRVRAARNDEGLPIPPAFCRDLAGCSRLTALVMSQCGMKDFPPGLTTLSSLQHLVLSEFYLPNAHRWHELAGMRHLTHLTLSQCWLDALPPTLSRLTGLKELCLLANWELSTGWEHLSSLRALTLLDLSYMHLTRLPPVLSSLTNLRKLNLYLCQNLRIEDDAAWQPLAALPLLHHLHADPGARQMAVGSKVWVSELEYCP